MKLSNFFPLVALSSILSLGALVTQSAYARAVDPYYNNGCDEMIAVAADAVVVPRSTDLMGLIAHVEMTNQERPGSKVVVACSRKGLILRTKGILFSGATAWFDHAPKSEEECLDLLSQLQAKINSTPNPDFCVSRHEKVFKVFQQAPKENSEHEGESNNIQQSDGPVTTAL